MESLQECFPEKFPLGKRLIKALILLDFRRRFVMELRNPIDKVPDDMVILAVSNSYEKKYYLDEEFSDLPSQIKDELKIMCVLYTEEIGGILTLMFDKEGNLNFLVSAKETDAFFDDIGSELKIRKIRKDKREFLSSLEKYYRVVYLGEEL